MLATGVGTATAEVTLSIIAVDDVPVATELELAQTHVLKPEGKRWTGKRLGDRKLRVVGGRDALVLLGLSADNERVVDAVLECLPGRAKTG